jgi:hypothetical protein
MRVQVGVLPRTRRRSVHASRNLMRSVGPLNGRLGCGSGRRVSTRPLRFLWKPIGRSRARRLAGGWTADGMPCPRWREHLIIRSQGLRVL